MLAGCSSSTLLSPRHRLRSEASAQFQACNFPSMSTQRLDLPCSFPRKEASRSQPLRPVGLSVEKPLHESKTSGGGCSIRQNIRLPPLSTTAQTTFIEGSRREADELWKQGKSLKRRASFNDDDESCISRNKRKRASAKSDDEAEARRSLSLGQLGSGSFWFQPSFEVPRSSPLITGLNSPQIPFSLTCSGEEERVCYVPGDIISPPLPMPNIPWVESIVTQITNLGAKNGEPSHRPVPEASGSSTSSESHSLGLRLHENPSGHEIGNGSGLARPTTEGGIEVTGGGNQEEHRDQDDDFELISLLMACVEAIGSRNMAGINHYIAKLGQLASPRGSPISRLSAYFTEALALRVARLWPHIFHISPPRDLEDDGGGTAMRLLNQVTPIPKFIHFTSNEILLRAFEGKDRVHIIDFDIKQGLQWPSLFQSLASRTNPPSHVRITGIGESKQDLIETGDRLAGFADALNLHFEFHPVVDRLEDVRLWMLHVKERESVAVNCTFQLHKLLYDYSGGALRDFLGLIRSTNPTVVLVVEQEADNNNVGLDARLSNSLKYYSAIFDSIDSSLPMESQARMKLEEMFGREIRNIIACEGNERLERREDFFKWKNLMEQGGGFRCLGITEREFLQSQMLLKMYHPSKERSYYSVNKQGQEDGGEALTLSWLDQPLYTVSAWAPLDNVGGSSSSYSQPT